MEITATVKEMAMDARPPQDPFTLAGRRLGALPLINGIAGRMGLARLLDKHMPLPDVRMRLTPATVIQVVIANLVLCHRPLYALAEWAAPYDARLLGLAEGDAMFLTDDRVGRALDLLFDADRGALLTELLVGVVGEFSLDLSQLHNDSTSVKLQGEFAGLDGSARGAKPTAAAARGHSKDHRPDLPQLVYILTVSHDGAVPVTYRLADGNTNDDPTHIPTWDTLVTLTGTPDFLYVADCKLASTDAMTHIDSHGGRFVTVLPRSRKEDTFFRTWITTHAPGWTEAIRLPGRRLDDPDRIYTVAPAPAPSKEGFRIIWVHSSGKHSNDADARQEKITRGLAAIDELSTRLAGPRCRIRDRVTAEQALAAVLAGAGASRWINPAIEEITTETAKKSGPGRPRKDGTTPHVVVTSVRYQASGTVDDTKVTADAASDGCFPLITNDRDADGHLALTDAQVLHAYRQQPNLERRNHLLKSMQHVAPVWLRTPHRVEALFCCHFLALMIGALLERQARHAMAGTDLDAIAAYPEHRACTAPSAERIFEIFADLASHDLHDAGGTHVQTFDPQLTAIQQQLLDLIGIPQTAYTTAADR